MLIYLIKKLYLYSWRTNYYKKIKWKLNKQDFLSSKNNVLVLISGLGKGLNLQYKELIVIKFQNAYLDVQTTDAERSIIYKLILIWNLSLIKLSLFSEIMTCFISKDFNIVSKQKNNIIYQKMLF
jgi:hypothetical protein